MFPGIVKQIICEYSQQFAIIDKVKLPKPNSIWQVQGAANADGSKVWVSTCKSLGILDVKAGTTEARIKLHWRFCLCRVTGDMLLFHNGKWSSVDAEGSVSSLSSAETSLIDCRYMLNTCYPNVDATLLAQKIRAIEINKWANSCPSNTNQDAYFFEAVPVVSSIDKLPRVYYVFADRTMIKVYDGRSACKLILNLRNTLTENLALLCAPSSRPAQSSADPSLSDPITSFTVSNDCKWLALLRNKTNITLFTASITDPHRFDLVYNSDGVHIWFSPDSSSFSFVTKYNIVVRLRLLPVV